MGGTSWIVSLAAALVMSGGAAIGQDVGGGGADADCRTARHGESPAETEPPDRQESGAGGQDHQVGGRPVISLLGEELRPVPIDPERREELEANLAKAKAAFDADPTDEEAIIWYGRRLAYLGRYREAIDVYIRGLNAVPESAKLRRHLGHRLITVREFEGAVLMLERAAPDRTRPSV